jgi:hypothetical protein
MEQQQTQERPRSVWLTNQAFEAIVAVVILLVGVVMMVDARRVGMDWASDGPKGGYFPFRTGAILSIASVVVFLRALFGKHRNHELFVSWDRFKMVLAVLIPTSMSPLPCSSAASCGRLAGSTGLRSSWSVSSSASCFFGCLKFSSWFRYPKGRWSPCSATEQSELKRYRLGGL